MQPNVWAVTPSCCRCSSSGNRKWWILGRLVPIVLLINVSCYLEVCFMTNHYNDIRTSAKMARNLVENSVLALAQLLTCRYQVANRYAECHVSIDGTYAEPELGAYWNDENYQGSISSLFKIAWCQNGTGGVRWFSLHGGSGSSKCFNQSQYRVSIRNGTFNIELPTE